jgi:hypothetical protein
VESGTGLTDDKAGRLAHLATTDLSPSKMLVLGFAVA